MEEQNSNLGQLVPKTPEDLLPLDDIHDSSQSLCCCQMLLAELGFLPCHEESIPGAPCVENYGMVRFICGTTCKVRGGPLGFQWFISIHPSIHPAVEKVQSFLHQAQK